MKYLWESLAIVLVWLPAIAAIGLSIHFLYYILFLLLASPIILVLLLAVLLLVVLMWRKGLIRNKRWVKLNTIVSVLVVLAVYMTQFPLYWAYWASLPQLEALATEVRSKNQVIKEPRQVGAFKVVEAGKSPRGSVYLWTELNEGGNEGFVHCEEGKTSEQDCLVDFYVNRRLSDRWYLLVKN
jgi:hypothetical protein